MDTDEKVLPILDIDQKVPPIQDAAEKVTRTLHTAQRVPAFIFVFVVCSLFFLVLRVPFRYNLFVDVRTERRHGTCPYNCPHTCPHHAQRGPA